MAPERKGSATDPLTNFDQTIDSLFQCSQTKNEGRQYKSYKDYPMYKYLAQFSTRTDAKSFLKATTSSPEESKMESEDGLLRGLWRRNYDNLSENDRQIMLVDEIFALYLYRISNRVNDTFYKIVLAYTILFRECLNELGWQKKIESENINIAEDPELRERMDKEQFCLTNNAEHAPEICNEFVTVFMENKRYAHFDISKPD